MKIVKVIATAAALAASTCLATTPAQAQSSGTAYLGQMMVVGFNFCPRGWAKAEGQLLPISQYSALFSLLGTMYGGDGRTTFGLPGMRGRSAISAGHGPGLTNYQQGSKGGKETNVLGLGQMPAHHHALNAHAEAGDSTSPTNNVLGAPATSLYSDESADTQLNNNSISTAGANQPVENRSPYLTLQWCIALQGVYPSRS